MKRIKKSKPTFIPVDEFLIESLKDPQEALGYLKVACEEYSVDQDLDSFINSLHLIAAAKGGTLQREERNALNEERLQPLLVSSVKLKMVSDHQF